MLVAYPIIVLIGMKSTIARAEAYSVGYLEGQSDTDSEVFRNQIAEISKPYNGDVIHRAYERGISDYKNGNDYGANMA